MIEITNIFRYQKARPARRYQRLPVYQLPVNFSGASAYAALFRPVGTPTAARRIATHGLRVTITLPNGCGLSLSSQMPEPLSTEALIEQLSQRIEKLELLSKTSPEQHFPTTGICSRKFLMRYFQISHITLNRWEQLGLKMVKLGTRSGYFFCADVLDLLMEFQDKQLPKFKSKMLQEIEARRLSNQTKG